MFTPKGLLGDFLASIDGFLASSADPSSMRENRIAPTVFLAGPQRPWSCTQQPTLLSAEIVWAHLNGFFPRLSPHSARFSPSEFDHQCEPGGSGESRVMPHLFGSTNLFHHVPASSAPT